MYTTIGSAQDVGYNALARLYRHLYVWSIELVCLLFSKRNMRFLTRKTNPRLTVSTDDRVWKYKEGIMLENRSNYSYNNSLYWANCGELLWERVPYGGRWRASNLYGSAKRKSARLLFIRVASSSGGGSFLGALLLSLKGYEGHSD